MIWSLAREQVRSQRRYAISAAVVIMVAVAVASYGALMTLTMTNSQAEVDHFMGYDRDTFADASTSLGPDFDSLAPNIDAANDEGHEVVANANVFPSLPYVDPYVDTSVIALYGDVDWAPVMVDGAAPGPGELAVNAEWARANGVEIGDDVYLLTTGNDGAGGWVTVDFALRVTGLTRSSVGTTGLNLYTPAAFVAWEDVPRLNTAWNDDINATMEGSELKPEPFVGVTISGNGEWPWEPWLAAGATEYGAPGSSAAAGVAAIAAIGFGALVVGLIAMAFALGRAQAQARTKWVGTVRALGATKRQVATASLVESIVVGVAAGIAGFVLGALGAIAHVLYVGTQVASPMILVAPTGYAALAAGALLLAVLLSLVVGAIPAFWSARMAPTAALKPVTDMSEAQVSRTVKTWPLVIVWGVALLVAISGAVFGVDGVMFVPVVVAAIALIVTSLMLAHEVLRRTLPWHAQRLSRSPHRVRMVAGDSISARPRQATIPAFIVALGTSVLMGLLLPNVASEAIQMDEYVDTDGNVTAYANPYVAPLPVLGVFAVVTFLCVIIAVATSQVTAREAATREALGLTRREGAAAAALQYLVAQFHGLALGVVGGLAAAAFLIPTAYDTAYSQASTWLSSVVAATALIIAMAATLALVGAAVAAAAAPKTAPLSRVEVSA